LYIQLTGVIFMSAVAEKIETEMPAPILFTDSAAAKVADLIAEEGNPT